MIQFPDFLIHEIKPLRLGFLNLQDALVLADHKHIFAPQEQEEIDRCRLQKRVLEKMAGKYLVKALLREHNQMPWSELLVLADGHPVKLNLAGHYASISHSHEMAAALVYQSPVGIDLEKRRHVEPDHIRFILHPEESEHLKTRPEDGIWIFNRKEALLKASGLGLMSGARLSSVLPLQFDTWTSIKLQGQNYQVYTRPWKDYCLSLAYCE